MTHKTTSKVIAQELHAIIVIVREITAKCGCGCVRQGIGEVMAKLGSTLKPTLYISVNDDDVWKVRSESTMKSHEVHFKLDVEFDESTPDGRKLRVRIPANRLS